MLIFVYGTLKAGFPNAGVNRGEPVAGEFRTVLKLPLVLVGERHTPWMVWQPGQGFAVQGQLVRVDATVLAAMDELEGVHDADGYQRRSLLVVPLADTADPPIEAQAYVKQPAQLRGQSIMAGPLPVYLPAHAALYRKRSATRG